MSAAGGNYSTLAVTGGVVAIHIQWICNLDFDFQKNCLPRWETWTEYEKLGFYNVFNKNLMASMESYLKDSKYNIHKGPSDILGPLEKRESKMIPKLV